MEEPASLALEGLATHYDCVVLGTNLAPSMVAAGAAFSSHSVLHLDSNDFYGHVDDASFTFDQANEWAKEMMAAPVEVDGVTQTQGEGFIMLREVARQLATFRLSSTRKVDADEEVERNEDATPSEEEVSALSERLRMRYLCRSPSRAARVLSCGPSYADEVAPSSVPESDMTATDAQKVQERNDTTGEDPDHRAVETTPSLTQDDPQAPCSALMACDSPVALSDTLILPRLCIKDLESTSRRWSLDMGSPMALFCSGKAVDVLISSSVGRYLEFLSVDALCVLENTPVVSSGMQNARDACECWRVPTSKKDIFASKSLGVLEKNRLMKLLRCCHNWGVLHVEGKDTLATQQDGELGSGRALSRPQNSAGVAPVAISGDDRSAPGGAITSPTGLDPDPYVACGARFQDFLDAWRLPARLRDAVLYAIALSHDTPRRPLAANTATTGTKCEAANSTTAREQPPPSGTASSALGDCGGGGPRHVEECSCVHGLAALHAHVAALGQFGDTAFLSSMYGSGEVAQAFCRLCAVSRGTYILRHALHAVVVEQAAPTREESAGAGEEGSGERVVGICDSKGHFIACDKFVCSSDYLLPELTRDLGRELNRGCRPASSSSSWTVRRVCIVDGPVVLGAERALVVIKPDPHACSKRGSGGDGREEEAYLQGIGNWGPIHALVSDESTMIAPAQLGASVVHLTMSAHLGKGARRDGSSEGEEDAPVHDVERFLAEAGEVLGRAIKALCEGQGAREVWHLSFALPVTSPPEEGKDLKYQSSGSTSSLPEENKTASETSPPPSSSSPSATAVGGSAGLPDGWAVAHRLRYSVDPAPVMLQAEGIFKSMFGSDAPFLVQDEEERLEAMRARGELEGTGDEDEDALAAAVNSSEQEERRVAALVASLDARLSNLEEGAWSEETRIKALESKIPSVFV